MVVTGGDQVGVRIPNHIASQHGAPVTEYNANRTTGV